MDTLLPSLVITEIGDRIATSVCGSLLAQAGATVILVEPRAEQCTGKWRNRPAAAAGKLSVVADSERDAEFIARLLARSDVIITSSDVSPLAFERRVDQVVCDITAFGSTGPFAGLPYSDAQIQAISGIADITGDADAAPSLVGFPIAECSAGVYAAAAIVAALRARRTHGCGQDVEIALFDCAVTTTQTFLVFHFVGESTQRLGNHHALVSPWNAYRASDGWVLICAATDDQWGRLCALMNCPELTDAPEFKTNGDRVAHRTAVDDIISPRVAQLSVNECITRLLASGIACGPIMTLDDLAADANLAMRKMLISLADPVSGKSARIAGTPLKASRAPGVVPASIPSPDMDRTAVDRLLAATQPPSTEARSQSKIRPCAGIRVLEIGQYTTAPLVARQLAALGAEVLKIEPPSGDSVRWWPPFQDGQGFFFTLSNADKRSLMLDLRAEDDKAAFRSLLKSADVLVENLKPGSLARLGFGPRELMETNPRLVYCGISGFGAHSTYPGRPAFDTVVQAMSGIMDLTRVGDMPTKAGISAADLIGGEVALFAILAALEHRAWSGSGQTIDLSMQDAAVWSTQFAWNAPARNDVALMVKCRNGYVLAEAGEEALLSALKDFEPRFACGLSAAEELDRAQFADLASRAHIRSSPVFTVSEMAEHEQTSARGLISHVRDDMDRTWGMLNSPLRLSAMDSRDARPIGALGEANAEILGHFKVSR